MVCLTVALPPLTSFTDFARIISLCSFQDKTFTEILKVRPGPLGLSARRGGQGVSLPQGEFSTFKPRFNKSEKTKECVLYNRGFVIAGGFYHEINYGGA
jgi:hypothetical protein